MVIQWLALLPHGEKIQGLNLNVWNLQVLAWVHSGYFCFLLKTKNIVRLIHSHRSECECESHFICSVSIMLSNPKCS